MHYESASEMSAAVQTSPSHRREHGPAGQQEAQDECIAPDLIGHDRWSWSSFDLVF